MCVCFVNANVFMFGQKCVNLFLKLQYLQLNLLCKICNKTNTRCYEAICGKVYARSSVRVPDILEVAAHFQALQLLPWLKQNGGFHMTPSYCPQSYFLNLPTFPFFLKTLLYPIDLSSTEKCVFFNPHTILPGLTVFAWIRVFIPTLLLAWKFPIYICHRIIIKHLKLVQTL